MSTDTATAASSVNLPVPVLPVFTCDSLALIFGTCLVDAAFVVERDTGNLVATNKRLLDLLGRDLEELEDREVPLSRFINADDRGIFQTWVKEDLFEEENTFETRFVHAMGDDLLVEISLRTIRWHGKEYCLGFVRPCGDRNRRELELRRQVELQKGRALQAVKSSLRVYELNEKIKSTLVLTTTLLNVENEEQLYKESVRVLTNSESLNFKDVTFLILEGSCLNVMCSTNTRLPASYSLAEDNKYSRAVRKGFNLTSDKLAVGGQEVLVPLRSRDCLLGIIEVAQHPREKAFFEEYRLITEWQREMLVQIGDIIALLLDNLRLKRELKRKSISDPLTGAFNRNYFMSRLNSEVQRATRYRRPVSLIFLDVDLFKQINDVYGHLQGDAVLRELSVLFQKTLRDADILCRYGGDEFVVMLPESDEEKARATAEKIRQAVREHHFPYIDDPSQRISVAVSLGTSTLGLDQTQEQFLQQADAALYRDKKASRGGASLETGAEKADGAEGSAGP